MTGTFFAGSWSSVFSSVLIAAGLALTATAAEPPTTEPVTPEQAVYRHDVALTKLLLGHPSDEELLRLGHEYKALGDYPRAAIFDLTALRGKQADPDIEYELACNFSLWGQKKLATTYLQHAADHGYWGYRVVTEDTDLNAIKSDSAFAGAVSKMKASFDAEAPKHAPGMTVKTPAGSPPADGWPVLFFLHGWASNRHDFDPDAGFVATLGYVGVTLDANELMGPGAYSWGRNSIEQTHARIQDTLKNLNVHTNPKRVYLQGFSQGAMYAARLLTDHPDVYAGAICNSPGSSYLLPKRLSNPAQTGTVVLSVGDHDLPGIDKAVDSLESLWKSAARPVHVIHFEGRHQLPPNPEQMFRTALEQLSAGT